MDQGLRIGTACVLAVQGLVAAYAVFAAGFVLWFGGLSANFEGDGSYWMLASGLSLLACAPLAALVGGAHLISTVEVAKDVTGWPDEPVPRSVQMTAQGITSVSAAVLAGALVWLALHQHSVATAALIAAVASTIFAAQLIAGRSRSLEAQAQNEPVANS